MTVTATVMTMTDMRHLLTAALLTLLVTACGPDEVIPPDWHADAGVDAVPVDACGTEAADAGVDAP